jgi:uncharacterized protein
MDKEQRAWLGRGWAYPVLTDPRTGGVAVAEYENDVQQSIRIILGTEPGERLMRPDFGCGIHRVVFETMDVETMTRVESAVRESLGKYETRIEILELVVDPLHALEGKLLISLTYRIRLTNQIGNLVYPFYFREGGPLGIEGLRG